MTTTDDPELWLRKMMVRTMHARTIAARLHRAEGERDRWENAAANCAQERRELREERDALRAALTRYGKHDEACAYRWDVAGGYDDPRPCTCGLDAALASSPREATPDHS